MENWYVIRTRPRWEKKVEKRLLEKGIDAFCPLVKTRRQWSDRVKTIDMPLIKSLLFVRVVEEQRTAVRLTEGVMNFEYRNGKPIIVREKLVQQIRQFHQAHHGALAMGIDELKARLENGQPSKNKIARLEIEILDTVLIADMNQLVFSNVSTDKV